MVQRPAALGTLIRLHALRIECTEGPDQGLSWELDRPRVTIGSGEDADVQLTDAAVSRLHVVVDDTPRGWLASDAGSKNGTLLDGVAVQAAFLREGAILHIGRSGLTITSVGESLVAKPSRTGRFGDALGSSPAMQRIFGVLERVAPLTVTVVLTGPTGAGKGALARALHEASARAAAPFTVLDCGAVDANLISAELFGHARGAFTGAAEARPGVFEVAHGGTLFIDEIGELPLELQPKLLRVLDERRVTRLGSHQSTPVDVRVIAATHRNLREMVAAGRFREDLLYRLAVVELEVPPLAARPEDLPLLARHFLEQLGESRRWPLADAVLERLRAHTWPGNVRELRNAVERAVALAGPGPLTPDHVAARPAVTSPPVPVPVSVPGSLDAAERQVLEAALARHKGNKTHIAAELGIAVTTLKRRMRKHGLE